MTDHARMNFKRRPTATICEWVIMTILFLIVVGELGWRL